MSNNKLLLERQSTPQLTLPAPSEDDLNFILSAGMRVPDHGALTPWFFTVVQGQGLVTLSHIFEQVAINNKYDDIKIAKVKKMPARAPLIIVISTQYQQHDKVPQLEQAVATGCCVHAMELAAISLGYGAMWRTGEFSYHPDIKTALSIKTKDDIIGYLYIGTASKNVPIKAAKSFENHVRYL
jgi:nitroreductase